VTAEDLQIATDRPPHIPEVLEIMGKTFSTLEARQDALCVLAKHVAGCRRCPDLVSKRTQTVFGVGNPAAEVMFIGEAPGAEEDAKGEPFVGPAGQLLDKIIDASQLKRQNLYICNILRCRPPGNRNPLPQEASNCREFLDAQIHVVQPKYIVCWGTVAAQNLLNRTEAVGKLRGQLFDYRGIKVMCTYHPSYLLRNPAAKKQVWEDMKFFMKHLGVELK
jgi:DNA polymerase